MELTHHLLARREGGSHCLADFNRITILTQKIN